MLNVACASEFCRNEMLTIRFVCSHTHKQTHTVSSKIWCFHYVKHHSPRESTFPGPILLEMTIFTIATVRVCYWDYKRKRWPANFIINNKNSVKTVAAQTKHLCLLLLIIMFTCCVCSTNNLPESDYRCSMPERLPENWLDVTKASIQCVLRHR